jgi:hypothetical protein
MSMSAYLTCIKYCTVVQGRSGGGGLTSAVVYSTYCWATKSGLPAGGGGTRADNVAQ